MASSPLQSSTPYYLMDPSQIPTDPAHNIFAAVEQAFTDCPVINFSVSRIGYCDVEFEFKFFRDENLSLESVMLEGKANVKYGCLFSAPSIANANIMMHKPGESDFGKTFLLTPGTISQVFLGSQYEGRNQYYTKCCCCISGNILDKNEKVLYTSELAGCNFNLMECIHGICCLAPMYDQKLVTMYTADESHQPAFSIWKKSNCGLCCKCQDATGFGSGLCIKLCQHTSYYKIEKHTSTFPGGMIYILQAALSFAMATKL